MIEYFPRAALRIYKEGKAKGNKKFEKNFQAFKDSCVNQILSNPENYLCYSTALFIYTEIDNLEKYPPKEFKENLHLWK
jgi:hypothetical protein